MIARKTIEFVADRAGITVFRNELPRPTRHAQSMGFAVMGDVIDQELPADWDDIERVHVTILVTRREDKP